MSDNPVKKPETSGSRAARVLLCPASKSAPDLPMTSSGELASLGSAVHEVLADVVRDNMDNIPDLHKYASKWAVKDLDELRMLCYFGLQAWRDIRTSLTVKEIELQMRFEFPEFILSGKADVIGETKDLELCVLDWKSGYIEIDTRDQLMSYLYLASLDDPDRDEFKGVTVWLRSREIHVIEVLREDLIEWFSELRLAMRSDMYNPGSHCQYCPLAHECKARATLVQSAATDMMEVTAGNVPATPQQLAELYPRSRLLKRALEKYDDILKQMLIEHGAMPTGDGRFIGMADAKRESIQFAKAHKPLMAELGLSFDELMDTLGNSISVSKKAIQDQAAAQAVRGQKGKAKAAIIELLRDAGAVSVKEFKKLSASKEAPDGQGN